MKASRFGRKPQAGIAHQRILVSLPGLHALKVMSSAVWSAAFTDAAGESMSCTQATAKGDFGGLPSGSSAGMLAFRQRARHGSVGGAELRYNMEPFLLNQ